LTQIVGRVGVVVEMDFDFAEAAPAEFRQGVDELGVVFLDG